MKPQWFKRILQLSTMAGLLAGLVGAANAADTDYPNKPVRVIVPLSAGGGADTVARVIAARLSEELGQPFVVENKPGASGAVGGAAVAQAQPDGQTLLLGFTTMAQLPALKVKMPFDPIKDLAPISVVAKSVNVLIASNKVQATTVKQLVADIKKNPDDFSYGSYGQGSTGHFLGEQFQIQTGTKLVHVPYKGAAPMMSDLLSGQYSFAFPDIGSARPHLSSDRIHVLAVASNERLSFLPNVPTMKEAGYDGFELEGWFTLFAPAKTPQPIIDKLSAKIASIVREPAVSEKLVGLGLKPVGSSAGDATAFIKNEMVKWGDVAQKADMKMD